MSDNQKKPVPVIVCTDKRGVIFGYAHELTMPQIRLENARFALYWASGGVLSLAEHGPRDKDRVGSTAPFLILPDVHAVIGVTESAERAWKDAPACAG